MRATLFSTKTKLTTNWPKLTKTNSTGTKSKVATLTMHNDKDGNKRGESKLGMRTWFDC